MWLFFCGAPLGKKVDIHPDYEAKLKEPVVLDNHFCTFKPHIVAPASWSETRRSRTPIRRRWPQHENRAFRFQSNHCCERQDGDQGQQGFSRCRCRACSIHPWMKAHLCRWTIRTWRRRARTARLRSRTFRPERTSFSSGTKRRLFEERQIQRRHDRRAGPGQAHDRGWQDARPGRHQSAGQCVEVKLSFVVRC